jgi:hypothetical protein
VKLRLCRSEARFAHEARLRRVKCLPYGKRKGSFLPLAKSNYKTKVVEALASTTFFLNFALST